MNKGKTIGLILGLVLFWLPAKSQEISRLENLVITEDWYQSKVVAQQLAGKIVPKSLDQYWLLRTRIELGNKNIRYDSVKSWLSRVPDSANPVYKIFLRELADALQNKRRIPTPLLESLHQDPKNKLLSAELAIYLGENYQREGMPGQALTILQSILKTCAKDSARYFKKIFNIYAIRALCRRDLKESNLAIEDSYKALRILENVPYPVFEEQARIYNNLGNIYVPLNFEKAEYCLKQSVYLREVHIKDTTSLTTGYVNLGILYLSYSQLERAEEYFNKALRLNKGILSANAEFNHVLLLRETDRINEAIQRLEQVVQPNSCSVIQFRIKSRLSNYYYAIQDNTSGEKYKEAARKCLKALSSDQSLKLEFYNDNVASGVAIDNINLALKYSDSASLIIANNLIVNNTLKDFHRERINLLIESSKYSEADQALQDYRNFLSSLGQKPLLYDSLVLDILQGLLLSHSGRVPEACEFYKSCFARLVRNPYVKTYPNELILLYTQAGIAAQKLHAKTRSEFTLKESLNYFRQALHYSDIQYASLSGSANKLQFNRSVHDLYGLFVETVIANPEFSSPEEIFRVFERSKSRTLHANLKNLKINSFHNVSAALRSKEESINKENRILVQSLSQRLGDQHSDPAELSQLQVQLETLSEKRSHFLDSLKKEIPDYFSLQYIQDESRLQELQAILGKEPETCLLSYHFSKDSAYLLLVTANQLTLHSLGQRIKITRLLKLFHNQMKFGVQDTDSAARMLYDLLIRPIQSRLPATTQHLIIIPDQQLLTLPFESLVDRLASTRKKYLIQNYSIRYHYSATLFVQSYLARRPVKHATVFTGIAPEFGEPTGTAVPVEGNYRAVVTSLDLALPPLPAARREVNSVADQFSVKHFSTKIHVGTQATEQRFKTGNLGDTKYLHIATHGVIDPEILDEPGVILGYQPGDKEDGILKASEFYNLKLSSDLVVLSACETGQGKLIKGEGIQNLARSVLYAGTPDVIVTLWKVQDQETAQLVDRFYHYLLKSLPPHRALQKMKVDMIRLGVAPIHWSPLILVGL